METILAMAGAAVIAYVIGYVKGYKRGLNRLARHIRRVFDEQ